MTNVVIGAGSGMGAAVARALVARGPLLVVDVNAAAVAELAAELGLDVTPVTCDVSDPDQVEAMMSAVDEIGALVSTAGISRAQVDSGERIFDVNLIGMARVLAAAEPRLRAGSAAVIVASMSAYRTPEMPEVFAVLDDPLSPTFFEDLRATGVDPDNPSFAYPFSKKGVQRMAQRLAAPWGARGARILSLSPGINDTPMNRAEEAQNPSMAQLIAASPLRRRGTPEEIASVAAFLTSDGAAYMTGSDVLVDGGTVSILPADTTAGATRAS